MTTATGSVSYPHLAGSFSPKVVTGCTEGRQPREQSRAMLNVSRVFTFYGHDIIPMPRSPLPRTLFAMLPILGALLAALAAP